MTTILIAPTPTCWTATQLIDGEPDITLIDLFGTHILPTAFTPRASGAEVRAELQRLNPDAVVTLL